PHHRTRPQAFPGGCSLGPRCPNIQVELIFGIRFATSNSSLNLAGKSKPDMHPQRQGRDVRRTTPERPSIRPSVVPDIVSVRTSGFTQGVAWFFRTRDNDLASVSQDGYCLSLIVRQP